MRNDTCVWPGCFKKAWAARGLPICGEHAEAVHYVMRPDVAEVRVLKDEIFGLNARIIGLEHHVEFLQGPKPAKKKAPIDGTVYILRCGGFIKIGWTSDMTSRMRSSQPVSVLLATMPGTRKDENRLHRRFSHLRTHGREWYPIASQITEYVGILVAQHGQPDPVTFAAKPVTVPRPHTSKPVGETSTRLARAV